MATSFGAPFGTGSHEPSPAVSAASGFDPSQFSRMRTWANLFDHLERETEDQRWLRNAAQWLRDNPDTSEEIPE